MLKKISLLGLFFLVYFLVIRPVRSSILSAQSFHIEQLVTDHSEELLMEHHAMGLSFFYSDLEVHYKISFDIYLLLAGSLLLLLNIPYRYLGFLIFVHALGLIFSNIFLYGGLYGPVFLLSGADLIAKYLIPLCSFGVVILGMWERKRDQNIGSVQSSK